MKSKLQEAAWVLEDRSRDAKGNSFVWPVVAKRRGYAEFVAYVYKIDRGENKPSLWYVYDIWNERIKRICIP